MHSNLETLKREIVEALRSEDFAVFFGLSNPEDSGTVYWDSERNSDYRGYLAAAQKVGARMIVFSEREFRTVDVDEALAEMEDCELTPEDRRSLERRLRNMRVYEGRTGALRLTFFYEGRPYVFELRTDWLNEFYEITDEIASSLPDDEDDVDDSLGGYYSRN